MTQKIATDHRAMVLEAVATNPNGAKISDIVADCRAMGWDDPRIVKKHIWILRKEGLIGRDDRDGHFITKAGLDWLTNGRFDKALPTYAPRPGARRKRRGTP